MCEQLSEQIDSARKLARQVADLTADGKDAAARGVFTRNWRESVPELPLRFSLLLDNVHDSVALALARRIIDGGSELPLALRRMPGDGGWQLMVQDKHPHLLGDLPETDADFLDELGKQASLFTAFLLQIKQDESGNVVCAVELVRNDNADASAGSIAFHDAVEALPSSDQ